MPFLRLGNGILCTVNGIHERKTIEKWEWDFNLSNRQARIVGFEKNNLLENEIRTPPLLALGDCHYQ